ncbi:MAG: hypothetical protein HY513_00695 [Candidatus Aenigmarchaeota archaeon]|nr:hypothetical protein [Candidatus Aenigmarchaeota archaeon]
MIINDEVYNGIFELEADDPYEKSHALKNKLSVLGRVVESKNELWTDGPEHRSVLDFSVTEIIDNYSHVAANFSMKGFNEAKLLQVAVKIEIVTTIKEDGFFSAAFAEYYMKTSYSNTSKMCRSKAANLKKEIQSAFRPKSKVQS